MNWTGFNASDAIASMLHYEKQHEVWVFYDPRDPKRAVLEPGASIGAWARAGLGFVLLILGITFLLPR